MSKFTFGQLKETPLSYDYNVHSLEEILIWLDVNVLSCSDLKEIFSLLEKHYHCINDIDADALNNRLFSFIFTSSGTSFSPIYDPQHRFEYVSDQAFYWLFKAMFESSALDKYILSSDFVEYAEKRHQYFKEKSMPPYDKKCSLTSQHLKLFEIFSELKEKLEDKIRRMNLSPQA